LGAWPQWVEKRATEAAEAAGPQSQISNVKSQTGKPAAQPPPSRGSSSRGSSSSDARSRNKYARPFGTLQTAALKAKIPQTETATAETQAAFGDGQLMSDPREARRLQAEFDRLTKELEQLEEEYFSREA